MASQALVGQVLDGKYSIEKPLGKGGMGTVYLATHIGTGRPVAVKVIAPDFMERAEFVERFRREAQAAGRLRHPNVVDVTDFGFSRTTDGPEVAYLVMEYLDGCTLGEILDEEKQLPVAWTIDIIEQVCSAVEEAHRQGIIHRDLKPDNIWLEPNQRGGYTVKVLDFGIAKLEETQLANAARARYTDRSGRGETRVDAPQNTLAESDSATVVDGGSRTLVSENETLALGNGSSDPEIEAEKAGSREVNLEGGTAIMDRSGVPSDPSIEDRGTVIAGGGESTERSDRTTPSTAALTRMGAVLGTPLYMSPEQCRGEKLTPGSDIYSLAVIVYQMLSGRLPFEGDYVEVMEGHKHGQPPPLDAKKVKRKLRETLMTSLAKAPEDRPESAEIFANKLRANSEGLGKLLTRALSIFGERLPKIMLLTVISFSIPIVLNFARVLVNIGFATDYLEESSVLMFISGSLSLVIFFLQIIAVAMLIGMLTWLVGQILAYPLRPLSLRAAFREVRQHVRSLVGLVTLSSMIAAVGYMFLIIPGILIASRYMLIAPSIMMEGVRGRAAFRRSVELYKRARVTVIATASLIFLISAILPIFLGLSIGSIVGNIEKSIQIAKMREEGVPSAAERKKMEEVAGEKKEESSDLNVNWGSRGFQIGGTDDMEKDENFRLRASIIEATFELIWTPIHLVIIAFSSMVSALIYFKTRQAGGESMQELLGKLNSANSPQSKWQERVNRRLIQSGRISSGSGTS
ncbi:MAG: serine/threonine protein kinase [Acidobacteriota bacterium]|nr:MAG: serine/threonine protein kinase [Acidobacteriota bacterium]